MAQLSVPSSDVQNTETNGCVNTHPGASSFFEALADEDETAYTNQNIITNVFNNEPDSVLRCGMQSIVDPEVDTGFTIRFIARLAKGVLNSNPTASITLENLGGFTIWTDQTLWSYLTTSFVLYEFALTEAEVQTIRSLGAWNDLTIRLRGHNQNINVGTPDANLAFAFVQLEAPLAGPSPDIEITGGPSLELSGASEFINGPTLGISGEGFLGSNQAIGGPEMGIASEGLVGWNEFVTGPNLGMNGSAVLVLSIDASGLYTFVKDKRNDTLYTRNEADDTLDVKIPKPFAKTALLGG